MMMATIAATMTKIADPRGLAVGGELFEGVLAGVVAVLT